MAKTELESRSKKFALEIIDLVERMPRNRASDVVGRQLLRSGTSVGANYREANRGVSRDDFINKVGIASKEAAESEFWLELISESPHLQVPGTPALLQESREVLAILTTIGKNAKKNRT
jgi:four helix bundle protein